jgi:hypothetical protein
MRYGYRKKTATPLDLNELFLPFATIPDGGISCDQDWINQDEIFDETISEVFLFYFYILYKLTGQYLDLGRLIS